ncbi:MAG TPA: DUF1360 domain-containing protein [Terracidiphilus sp.]|jgi:hypothetical protein|nr:DUF1360 domain-containing protein [Terracidiphilus sp.]
MWNFLLAVLATWKLTHLLAEEDGPADLIVRFRALLGNSVAGKLMDCFYCLSFWIAAPAALFVTRRPLEWLMNWLALSGGACLLERITNHDAEQQAVLPTQQGGSGNVLRFETYATEEQPGFEHNDGEQSIHGPIG